VNFHSKNDTFMTKKDHRRVFESCSENLMMNLLESKIVKLILIYLFRT